MISWIKEIGRNEVFIIILAIILFIIIIKLPRIFPTSITILLFLVGAATASFYDIVISEVPYDFYDVFDNPNYEPMITLLYIVFGSFAYIFIYFYEKLHLKNFYIMLYILGCSLFAVIFEGVMEYFNVFTYKGWKLFFSFPVYLSVQWQTILFYNYIKGKHKKFKDTN